MDDDHLDQLIDDARNAGLERNREAFEALWTRHGFVDGQDLDELIARAMLDELFPAARERLKLIILAYICLLVGCGWE